MIITGKIVHIDYKWALLLTPDNKKYKINFKKLNTALYNDVVQIKLEHKNTSVVKIIKRSDTIYLGIIEKRKNVTFVRANGQNTYSDFFISNSNLNDASHGDVVKFKFIKWNKKDTSPCGEVIEIISKSTEIENIVFNNKLPYYFPENVLKNSSDLEITKKLLNNRIDLTHLKCYTIDPKYSTDHDDAISIEKIDDSYIIGIHIADVSAFIMENSLIDLEALKRSFTLYLPHLNIPMLPHKLSNGLCSLKQNLPKLTISVLFSIDYNFNITNVDVKRSIIIVDQNLTYSEVNNILKDETHSNHEYFNLIKCIVDKLKYNKKNRLQILQSKIKLELDSNNNYIPIFKEKEDAEYIVEELMILANSHVANILVDYFPKSLLRTHNSPTKIKIKQIKKIANKLNYIITEENFLEDFNKIIQHETDNHKHLFNYLLLKSQKKAIYGTTSNGHFALNVQNYTHFTSPIRRYSDIIVHRLLIKYINSTTKLESNLLNKIKTINNKEKIISKIEKNLYRDKIIEYLKTADREVDGQIIEINKKIVKVRSDLMINGIIKRENLINSPLLGNFLKLKVKEIDSLYKKIEFIETE